MLSVLLLAVILIVVFGVCKSFHHPVLAWTKVIVFNFFILELIAYICLVALSWRLDNIFLVGNQGLLDGVIRSRLVQMMYEQRRDLVAPYRLDPDTGYTAGENKMFLDGTPLSNSRGMRSDREYPLIPPDEKIRFVAIGDSFVHCDGEVPRDCWTALLEKNIGNAEVLNLGVGGYGLGQSYVRFLKDGLRYTPDVVILNYTQLTSRDALDPRDILAGRKLYNADLYRVNFELWQDLVVFSATDIMDLFAKEFRERFIYEQAGFDPRRSWWGNPFFGFSNTGLFIKQAILKRELPKQIRLRDEEKRAALNLRMLKDLFELAKRHQFQVILTSGSPKELPGEYQSLIAQSGDYVTAYDLPSKIEQLLKRDGLDRSKVLNSTGHFNPQGNRYYAGAVYALLKSRSWGVGKRRFHMDGSGKTFIREN